jgi:hypothetical protein
MIARGACPPPTAERAPPWTAAFLALIPVFDELASIVETVDQRSSPAQQLADAPHYLCLLGGWWEERKRELFADLQREVSLTGSCLGASPSHLNDKGDSRQSDKV